MAQFIDMEPVQQLSIHWIDLRRVPNPTKSLSDIVEDIIANHNSKIKRGKNSDNGYCKGVESVLNGYSFKTYSYCKTTISNIALQTQANPNYTQTSQFILFFFQEEPRRRIIALTSGQAWSVVRPYIDYGFPVKIAEKVADPENMIQLVRRCLFGPNTREDILHPSAYELYKRSNLYHLVESFQCNLKRDSSLFLLINSMEHVDRCLIKVTQGLFRIERQIAIENYPDIFNLLVKYVEEDPMYGSVRVEKADPKFEFLHFLQAARLSKKHLDGLLIKYIFSRWIKKEEPLVDVRHKNLKDFLFSNSFEIKIGSEYEEIGSNPPEIQDILEIIGTDDEEQFTEAFLKGKLKFTDLYYTEHKDSIIDYIEGQVYDAGEMYFKIKKMWYVLEADYLALLWADFKNLIENDLIAQNDEWQLPHPWQGKKGGEKEDVYNRTYLKLAEDGYLMFDQICPNNIEPCDILKYNENAVYLYQVKEKFGQDTRVACSQIMSAATMIRSALATHQPSNYLEILWHKATDTNSEGWRNDVKRQMEALGKDNFMSIFRDRKIVFVYAYLPEPNKDFLSLLSKSEKPIEERLVDKLITSGYLDSQRRLTGRFFSTVEETFSIEGETKRTCERIYRQLAAGRFSKSTLAKIELVQLAQNLRDLNFHLKICEIRRS
ncbi:hypothetical protein V9T40_003871 [Parthenolecanium corni]|uniref:Uncharacterized protein n=1 Tax=Parthenolecanium corni TaxID=536013 RepID=A0AAN9YAH8_9HEMI